MSRRRRDLPPNKKLRAARERLLSPSGSGRPMSTQELAEAINTWLWDTYRQQEHLTYRDVAALERGDVRWPGERRREAFRAVLGVNSDAGLGFYINRRPAAGTPDPAVESAPAVLDGETQTAPDGQRRSLLRGIALVAASSGLIGGSPWMTTRRIGRADVSRLNAVTALYRTLDYEFGGGMLVADVGAFAESASALLDLSYADTLAPSLLSAVAAARQLAGWATFDAGHHSDAQRHFLSAERAAVAADDQLMTARVRYCQARQYQHLHHNRDALDTLRLARDQLGAAATPAVAAMLHGAEAASLAAFGDRQSALARLGEARKAFDKVDVDREPEWMRFYDQGEMLAQYGRVYRDLARVDRRDGPAAVRWVSEAIAAFGPQNVRSSVLNEVGLCSALFLADEPERALVVGRRVVEQGKRLTSRRIIDRVVNLRRDLGRHVSHPEIADFVRTVTLMEVETR